MTLAEYHYVGRIEDFPAGEMKVHKIEGYGEVVLTSVDGTIYAFSNFCTHAFQPLAYGFMQGCQAVCIYHWAVFDVRDGSIVGGPAYEPLPVFEVKIEGDEVHVGLPPAENQ